MSAFIIITELLQWIKHGPHLKKLILILMEKISIFPDQCVFLMPGFGEDTKKKNESKQNENKSEEVNVS